MANKNPKTEQLNKPWSATNQPKNRGRKRSLITNEEMRNVDMSYNDIQTVLKYIMTRSKSELTQLILKDIEDEKKKKKPKELKTIEEKETFLILIFARGMLQDYKDGSIENVIKMIEKTFGK